MGASCRYLYFQIMGKSDPASIGTYWDIRKTEYLSFLFLMKYYITALFTNCTTEIASGISDVNHQHFFF